MQVSSNPLDAAGPERLLNRTWMELSSHALWDALLLFFFPFVACLYGAVYLYRTGWLDELALSAVGVCTLALLALGVVLYYRPRRPLANSVAHRIDQVARAEDRFITLATIEPDSCSKELLARLRREAASMQSRVVLKRDFPYRLKRSFYISLVVSLLIASLFHLWPAAYSALHPVTAAQHLRDLAAKMAERPNLKELARNLQSLGVKIEDPKATPEEKQQSIKNLEQQVTERQQQLAERQKSEPPQKGSEQGNDDSQLLSDASATLKNLEQESGSGKKDQSSQTGTGGSIQSNLPQDSKGENKPAPGGEGESKGEMNAQASKDMQQGKSAQGEKMEKSGDKTAQNSNIKGETKGSEPDPNRSGAEKNTESATKAQQAGEDKGGKMKNSGDTPLGAPPADRFNQGGEGPGGLKNTRYVTVQLPEQVAGEEKGETSATKSPKGNRVGAKLPVSNAPLPAQIPDAPTEKQPMPLEYRGIIR